MRGRRSSPTSSAPSSSLQRQSCNATGLNTLGAILGGLVAALALLAAATGF
jgi:hypothetical protein